MAALENMTNQWKAEEEEGEVETSILEILLHFGHLIHLILRFVVFQKLLPSQRPFSFL